MTEEQKTIEQQIAECKQELEECIQACKQKEADFEADQSQEKLDLYKSSMDMCKRKHHKYCRLRKDFSRQLSKSHLPQELQDMFQ